jgi:hypothetical protein
LPALVPAGGISVFTKGMFGRPLEHAFRIFFGLQGMVPYTTGKMVVNPLGQMLANAAKWSYLARADVELGLFDRAPRF